MVTRTQPSPSTWVEVDLAAICANVRAIRRLLASTTQLMAVVKANAYGHGMLQVAEALSTSRLADSFGVASLAEGITLRNHGVTRPILMLGQILPDDAPFVAQHGLTATVCTRSVAQALARAGQRAKEPVRVHLKVDTGMGRYGVWHTEALAFVRWLRRLPGLLVEGLATHLAGAVQDRAATEQQLATFRKLVAACERSGVYVPLKHVANSMGLLAYPDAQWDLVRVGLALYGVSPKAGWVPPIPLRPSLRWRARVAFVKSVPAGCPISYGGAYRTTRRTRIATIPVGYAHGYALRCSNRAWVLANDRRLPVVGRVTMDHTMVEVGPGASVRLGDVVTLVGHDRRAAIRIEAFARWAGTIAYEAFCSLSPSIPRRYLPAPRSEMRHAAGLLS